MSFVTRLAKKSIEIYDKKGIKELVVRAAAHAKYKIKHPVRKKRKELVSKIRIKSKISIRQVEYNGITVRPFRVIDDIVPISRTPNRGGHKNPSQYEKGLVNSISSNVKTDDYVIVIGAGLGVTATVAAEEAYNGEVMCYEGDRLSIDHLHETINLNNVGGRVRTRHAVVENKEGLRSPGIKGEADVVPPSSLPECDVLELDCEGAELEILDRIDQKPRCIIVETHGNRSAVSNILQKMGYKISNEVVAEVGPYRSMCEENGIYVITAKQKQNK